MKNKDIKHFTRFGHWKIRNKRGDCTPCKNEMNKEYRVRFKDEHPDKWEENKAKKRVKDAERRLFDYQSYRGHASLILGAAIRWWDKNSKIKGNTLRVGDLLTQEYEEIHRDWVDSEYDPELTPCITKLKKKLPYTVSNYKWTTFLKAGISARRRFADMPGVKERREELAQAQREFQIQMGKDPELFRVKEKPNVHRSFN